jgi:hypothetical protein
MGGQTRLSPQTPLGNFDGLILRIALSATRGGAELETDRERSECQWSVSIGGILGLDALTHFSGESV